METIRAAFGEDADPSVEVHEETDTDPRLEPGPVRPREGGGRYSNCGEIARGGMGAIYKVRDEDLRRNVAMKVLLGQAGKREGPAPAADSGDLCRFLEEAQITAQLVHPGVVPVHELGIDGTGRVFFTMSLVRGRTLGEVIERARTGEEGWTLPKALRVLERVCETMAFAHARGVVHRDLKPNNVMVGRYGEVYVMDWGLAKVAGHEDRRDLRIRAPDHAAASVIETRRADTPDGRPSPLATMDGAVLGTPAYMSLEQAEGRAEAVDSRSDVYAIGAMLYELLTGRMPYVEPGEELSPYALLARVYAAPPRPIHEAAPDAPPELVAIAAKAMAREKAGRYDDAASLGDDLQRFMSGHVVRAYKTGALVELVKWVLRNRAVAATAAAALVLVSAVTGFYLRSLSAERDRVAAEASRANRAEDVATARAEDAERQRAEVEDLLNFMLFDLRDGLEPIGRLDLLGEVAQRAKDYFERQPVEEETDERRRALGVALTNVGSVLGAQGDLEEALATHRAALEIAEQLSRKDPENAEWRRDLSVSLRAVGEALFVKGDLEGALRHYRRARAIRVRLSLEHRDNARARQDLSLCHSDVGDVLEARGDLDAALVEFRKALEIRAQLTVDEPAEPEWIRELAAIQIRVGDVLEGRGDLEAALEFYRLALDGTERLVREHPANTLWLRDLAVNHNRVGDALLHQGELDEALRHARRAQEINEELTRADPTNCAWIRDLHVSHNKVGGVLMAMGDPDAALARYREALEVAEQLTRKDPSNARWLLDLSQSYSHVGGVLASQGHAEEALRNCREAVAIRERLVRMDPTNSRWLRELAFSQSALGDALMAMGDLNAALESCRAVVEITEKLSALDPSNTGWRRDLAVGHNRLAEIMWEQGDLDAALRAFRQVVEIVGSLSRQDPSNSLWLDDVAVAHSMVGSVLDAQGDVEGALECYRQVLEVREQGLRNHPGDAECIRDLSVTHYAVGDTLKRLGRLDAAVERLRTAVEMHARAVELAPRFASEHSVLVGGLSEVELLAGLRAPESPTDHLGLAYACHERKEYGRSAEHFEHALRDDAIRGDLESGNLYNAACTAALAVGLSEGQEAGRWSKTAIRWLREDLRLRARLLARLDKALAGEIASDQRKQMETLRGELLRQREWARKGDEDLAAIRTMDEFQALFE